MAVSVNKIDRGDIVTLNKPGSTAHGMIFKVRDIENPYNVATSRVLLEDVHGNTHVALLSELVSATNGAMGLGQYATVSMNTATAMPMYDPGSSDESPKHTLSPKAIASFQRIVIDPEKLEIIETAIAQLDHHNTIFNTWGFGEVFEKGTAVSLLFYGPPGTGKTLTAQAIANRFKMELKVIQSGEIESSEPGQAERNIKAFFENAMEKNWLLLFDECDSLITDRNEVGMILGAQINALLTALENFTGVCVFTTNRLGRLDPAFERRVSAKVEFTMPTEKERREIWKKLIPEKAPIHKNVDFDTLAKFEIAGGHIKNAILSAARYAAYKKKKHIDEESFEHAIKSELEGKRQFEAAIDSSVKVPREGAGFSRSGYRKVIQKGAAV